MLWKFLIFSACGCFGYVLCHFYRICIFLYVEEGFPSAAKMLRWFWIFFVFDGFVYVLSHLTRICIILCVEDRDPIGNIVTNILYSYLIRLFWLSFLWIFPYWHSCMCRGSWSHRQPKCYDNLYFFYIWLFWLCFVLFDPYLHYLMCRGRCPMGWQILIPLLMEMHDIETRTWETHQWNTNTNTKSS